MNKQFKSSKEIYEDLRKSVRRAVPESIVSDSELEHKAELVFEINRRAFEQNAIILKHNYMEPVLFRAVEGYCGDSLELARRAAQTEADKIIFCGVNFMAETAKILNPSKKVLVPRGQAGCSLADNITAREVLMLKEKFPGLPVVTYVNSTAEVKAASDVCCTSGNVLKVIDWVLDKFKTKSLIFIPDKYMAGNIARERGMEVCVCSKDVGTDTKIDHKNNSTVITWDARCYVHEQYALRDVEAIRMNYPGAMILAHPECRPESGGSRGFFREYFKNGGICKGKRR